MSVLNYERSGVDYVAWGQRTWDELAEFCRTEIGPDGNPLAFDSPCTGDPVSVSGVFTRTARIHMHDGQVVGNGRQTITGNYKCWQQFPES